VTREAGILVSLLARPDAAVGALTPDDWERWPPLPRITTSHRCCTGALAGRDWYRASRPHDSVDASRASAARNLLLVADLGRFSAPCRLEALP